MPKEFDFLREAKLMQVIAARAAAAGFRMQWLFAASSGSCTAQACAASLLKLC